MDIVRGSSANNLTGIKDKISKTLREKHKLITGNPKEFKKYTTGKYSLKNDVTPTTQKLSSTNG